jgi:hypothetical protein
MVGVRRSVVGVPALAAPARNVGQAYANGGHSVTLRRSHIRRLARPAGNEASVALASGRGSSLSAM